jgi:hypothetical protein
MHGLLQYLFLHLCQRVLGLILQCSQCFFFATVMGDHLGSAEWVHMSEVVVLSLSHHSESALAPCVSVLCRPTYDVLIFVQLYIINGATIFFLTYGNAL